MWNIKFCLVVIILSFTFLPVFCGRCTGDRKSKDSIVILGQKGRHSSYGHASSLAPVLKSLHLHYEHVSDADVLIWHEDMTMEDLPHGIGFVPRLCRITDFNGTWGPAAWDNTEYEPHFNGFSRGYHFMIRF